MAEMILTDIPMKDVIKVINGFINNNCTEVNALEQDNKLWTITAKCHEEYQ
jgi:hypothetical protein